MSQHVTTYLLGLLGGLTPGGFRLVWKIRRGRTSEAGTIDLTAYKTRQP